MSDAAQDLPGFDLKALVRKSDDIADLSEEKEYTAERLLVSHPERYEIARRLFFELGLSKRGICDICRLNSRTLNALIEREMKTRGADFLSCAAFARTSASSPMRCCSKRRCRRRSLSWTAACARA